MLRYGLAKQKIDVVQTDLYTRIHIYVCISMYVYTRVCVCVCVCMQANCTDQVDHIKFKGTTSPQVCMPVGLGTDGSVGC